MLEELALADFTPYVGQPFTLWWDHSRACTVTLVEASPLRARAQVAARDPFQLRFCSAEHSAVAFLPQRLYSLTHEVMGQVDLFLVPVGPPSGGEEGFVYQAVFN